MRGAVLGSGVVHLAILIVVLVVRANAPIIVPGPEVVQVALLDAPAPVPTVLPATPPPKPQPPPEVAPNDEEGVRIEKPRPKPQPVKKEEEPKPPQNAQPAAALPFAAVGPPGLKGQVAVDASDFEFTYYLMLVRNRIAQNWTPPGGGAQGAKSVIYFRITRDGGIVAPRVEEGSGVDYFDSAALHAVQVSSPLPPLPLGWSGSDLGVHFGFEYTGP